MRRQQPNVAMRLSVLAAATLFRIAWSARLVLGRLLNWKLSGAQVAVFNNQQVIMIRNSYRRGLYLPGGGSQGSESKKTTALRELREEVSLDLEASDLNSIGRYAYRIGGVEVEDEIFLSNPADVSGLKVDGWEVTEVVKIGKTDLLRHRAEIQPHVFKLFSAFLSESSPNTARRCACS